MLAKSDFFRNYYIVDESGETEIISSTSFSTLFVSDFSSEQQFLNKPSSLNSPWTPEERFERNRLSNYEPDDLGKIGESKNGDALEMRALMVDIARNFHSLETLKVTSSHWLNTGDDQIY